MSDQRLDFIEKRTGSEPSYSVIWLHGLGADGHDFEPLVPELGLPQRPGVRFVFPHAPQRPVTINAGMVMRAWYDITGLELTQAEDSAGIEAAREAVRGLIDEQSERGIPPERIVLAGFSQGGAIALYTALTHDRRLAGVMGLSCYLPLASRFPEAAAEANRETPIFMAHGSMDPMVPVQLGETTKGRLQSMGYSVSWHTYPIAHAVAPDEVRDIAAWLRATLALDSAGT